MGGWGWWGRRVGEGGEGVRAATEPAATVPRTDPLPVAGETPGAASPSSWPPLEAVPAMGTTPSWPGAAGDGAATLGL